MTIISISIPDNLLEKVDQYIKEQGYQNRSEITRQALRVYISEAKNLAEHKGKIIATITIIYQKGSKRSQIVDTQHRVWRHSPYISAHSHRGRLLHRNHYSKRRRTNHANIHHSSKSKQANPGSKSNSTLKTQIHAEFYATKC